MTLILSGTDGLSDVDGSAATPAIRGTDANTGIFFPAADTIAFSEGGVEAMRIDSSGNVGIGTSSPKSDVGLSLHLYNSANTGTVASNTYLLVESSTRNSVIELSGSASSTNSVNFSDTPGTTLAGIVSTVADQNLVFRTGGTTERMRIDSSGNVGIGTSSPNSKLQVKGPINVERTSTTDYSIIDNEGNLNIKAATGGVGGSFNITFATAGSERARIDSSGNLLVGKTSDTNSAAGVVVANASGTSGLLKISKTASGTYNSLLNYYNGTYVGGVDYSNTATSFPTSSDIRLKKDIVDAGSASAKIDQIRIVSHGWKHDDETVEFGVIAQELNLVAPQAVTVGDYEDEIQKTWGVDYSKLVPMLIKAHQEQQAIITSLTDRITALEAK